MNGDPTPLAEETLLPVERMALTVALAQVTEGRGR